MKILFISLTLLFGTCLSSTTNRVAATALKTDNENTWGEWSSAIYCDEDTYAIGIKLRVEGPQSMGTDDTAGSAFRMICGNDEELNSGNELPWGTWASVKCPLDSFVTGFNTKNEATRRRLFIPGLIPNIVHHFTDQGYTATVIGEINNQATDLDNTALNSVKAICSDPKHTIIEPSNAGPWGTWGNENEFRKCSDTTSICGFKTRAETLQGNHDDSGLNAIRMYCCDNKITFSNVVGRWKGIQSQGGGGSISYWYTVGVSKQVSDQVTDSWTNTLTATAGANYEFASASLSAAVARAVTKTSITSVTKNVEERKVFKCEDGDQAAYQWVTSVKQSVRSMTIDFEVESSNIWCVSDMNLIPECPPKYCVDEDCQACLPPFGASENYRGYQSLTISGKQCQKWTSQSPHKHDNTPAKRPNKGLGDHNYCRNPDGEKTIWCYTTDSKKRWDFCAAKTTFGVYEMIEINVITSVIVTTTIILCFVCILSRYYSKKGYKKVVYIDEENDV